MTPPSGSEADQPPPGAGGGLGDQDPGIAPRREFLLSAPGVATTNGPVSPEADSSGPQPESPPAPPPAPLLTLRDALPAVCETPAALIEAAARIKGGTGPIALDAERASGYRYSARAYLVQVRREGSGTTLIDPIDLGDLSPLTDAFVGEEWILHAASQDLPCLAEIGLRPTRLFDTELAGRLLGFPRVGLATLVEETLGWRMRKEHSAVDWSTRPLPEPWLQYAALDVEALIELRDDLHRRLVEADKWTWAEQEFAHLIAMGPPPAKVEPWRRTSGLHRVRGRRSLAAVRALWEARDTIAAERDVTPGRILPDSAIVAAATESPQDRRSLLAVRGFHGRGAQRYSSQWVEALNSARELPDRELPAVQARHDGPPPPRAWADKHPIAAARLSQARAALGDLAEKSMLPVENLMTPDYVRRVLWTPPAEVRAELASLGARPWQVDLTAPILETAIAEHPDP